MSKTLAKAAGLPKPRSAMQRDRAGRRDPDDEDPPPRRRLTPGDRQQAELAAALQAKLTGAPVFPFPPELKEEHKPYWTETVNSKPHDYFNMGDIHLLKLYCRVAADIDRLDREIADEGSVILNGRGSPVVNPRIIVRSIAETRLMALSTKLRLQPSARYDSEDDRKKGEKKKRADRSARAIHEDEEDGESLIAIPSSRHIGDLRQ